MSPRRQRLLTVGIVSYITFIGGTAYAHTGAIPDSVRLIFIAGPLVVAGRSDQEPPRDSAHHARSATGGSSAIWLLIAASFAWIAGSAWK
jgi:hypothetical protein